MNLEKGQMLLHQALLEKVWKSSRMAKKQNKTDAKHFFRLLKRLLNHTIQSNCEWCENAEGWEVKMVQFWDQDITKYPGQVSLSSLRVKLRLKKKQVTQKWQAVRGSTNYVPLLLSTTNANFQDSSLSGILPVKNQECKLCPILMSAYYWCQWKCFVTWTWTILPVQPEICLYQIQGLGLFWLLHTLSPASGQFFTSTDQMYHRKFSSKTEEWDFSIHGVLKVLV